MRRLVLFAGLGLTVVGALFAVGCSKFGPPPVTPPTLVVSTGTVKDGDVFANILRRYELGGQTGFQIERTLNKEFQTRYIQKGNYFEISKTTDGAFHSLRFCPDEITTYVVTPASAGFQVLVSTLSTEWRQFTFEHQIKKNLYLDLLNLGYGEPFVASVVGDLGDRIFAWRIDFFTEQRAGDKLKILMEQEFEKGSSVPLHRGQPRILMASYIGEATKTRDNIAIRYVPQKEKRADYFDNEGNVVRKAFLRAPFSHRAFRISSGFTSHRFHPILRKWTAHHGIDYAAPYGTAVVSVGTGRVTFAGWKGGYGNCIEIRHTPRYLSRYGHLSKIRVHLGDHVAQSDYIGNVGSTGLSTGPHLHFEMFVDGVTRNFLQINVPPAEALGKEELPMFFKDRDALTALFNSAPPLPMVKVQTAQAVAPAEAGAQ